jgi:hypothetical protein
MTRYRAGQPVLHIAAADVPRFLGADHPVVRGLGWRLELREQRRRHTRALKKRATHAAHDARLQAHLQQTAEEVERALADGRRSWRRALTGRR